MAKKEKKVKKSSARKSSSVPTRVYTYGARLKNKDHIKIVHDQLFVANKYRNKLVEIEINRRNRFRRLRSIISPTLREYERQYQEYELKILELRKKISEKDKEDLENSERIQQIRALRKERNELYDTKISAEYKRIQKEFFDEADKEFLRLKTLKIAEYAKKIGKSSLGPNSNERAEAVSEAGQLMLKDDRWHKAWKVKHKLDLVSDKKRKLARENSECYPGVYLNIEKAIQQSFKTAVYNPQFKRFDHSGAVGIQLTKNKGLKADEAFAMTDDWLKIEFPEGVFLRHKKKAAIAHIKLKGKSAKDSIYIDVPFVYHRPLPEDAVIKWLYLVVKREGTRNRYELQFTIESETFKETKHVPQSNVTAAINLGWRVLNDSDNDIKIATVYDGQTTHNIVLPAKLFTHNKFANRLLKYSDRYFNKMKSCFVSWNKNRSYNNKQLQEFANSASYWKSHGKMAKLAHAFCVEYLSREQIRDLWEAWKKERFENKLDLFTSAQKDKSSSIEINEPIDFDWFVNWCIEKGIANEYQQMALYLEWWRRKDSHLTNCARSIQANLQRSRREIYRRAAAKLARQYENVVITNWDKRKTAEVPDPEYDDRNYQEENANTVRQFAGISVFVSSLNQALQNRIQEKKLNGATKQHYNCSGEIDLTNNKTQMVRCKKCNKLIDQDVNSTQHLYYGSV